MGQEKATVSFGDVIVALADVQRRKLLTVLPEHNPQDDSTAVVGESDIEATGFGRLVKMYHGSEPS